MTFTAFRKQAVKVAGVAALLAAVVTLFPSEAQAQRRGGFRPRVFFRGFYGSPFFGFGYGFAPYWVGPYGPYGVYGPRGGVDMNAAMIAGWGAVDLDVKPGEAEVWVDGKFVAEARDLDGDPSYLWLPEGTHRVVIYKGGFANYDEQIDVRRAMRFELKVRMEKGESQPPARKPADAKTNNLD